MNTCSPVEGETFKAAIRTQEPLLHLSLYTWGWKSLCLCLRPTTSSFIRHLSIAAEVVRLILVLFKNPPTVFSPWRLVCLQIFCVAVSSHPWHTSCKRGMSQGWSHHWHRVTWAVYQQEEEVGDLPIGGCVSSPCCQKIPWRSRKKWWDEQQETQQHGRESSLNTHMHAWKDDGKEQGMLSLLA